MTTTIDQLTKGQIVTAIDGKELPFPFEVVKVQNCKLGAKTMTVVKFAHGGGIMPTDSKSMVATVA